MCLFEHELLFLGGVLGCGQLLGEVEVEQLFERRVQGGDVSFEFARLACCLFLFLALVLIQRRQYLLRVLARQRNFLQETLDLFFHLLLPQKALLDAWPFLARTAVVDVLAAAFLDVLLGGNGRAAGALREVGEREVVSTRFLRPASLREYMLYLVKKFLCDERLVCSLKNFRLVFHKADVEDVLEQVMDFVDGYVVASVCFEVNVLAPLCDLSERMLSGRVPLEYLLYFGGFVRVHVDSSRLCIVEVAEWCKHGPDAVSHFLPHASGHVFSQVVHVVLALAERDLEHEQSLRCRFKPECRKFEGTNQAAIDQMDDLPAVHAVASETVWMPAQNSICFPGFDE